MRIFTEEKRLSLSFFGTEVARAHFLYPRFEGCVRISGFYADMEARLEEFFEKAASACRAEYENTPRGERRSFAPLCIRLFSSVVYASEREASVTAEYAVSRGADVIFYRKLCFVWDTERELLLPPARFLRGRRARLASKNEFYIDGENVYIVENLFPNGVPREGTRVRLCDYVRQTKVKRRNICTFGGEQS